MKCHYIFTEKGEKVLIPYCWAVVNSGDMALCTCRSEKEEAQFQREEYNKTVKALKQEIKDLERENAYLNRIIKKLTKNEDTQQKETAQTADKVVQNPFKPRQQKGRAKGKG